MKIKSVKTYIQSFALTRPYAIAFKASSDTVKNIIVEIETESGLLGLGAGAPCQYVTGETIETGHQRLSRFLPELEHKDLNHFNDLKQYCCDELADMPAASVALNMALYDLHAQRQNKPLVAILGQVHQQLPTSITIGIKNVADTLIEAQEYVDRGFTILKVKLGQNVNEDIERLIKLREVYEQNILIRVDPNQGYSINELMHFIDHIEPLNIEMIEQPLQQSQVEQLYKLNATWLKKIALDENVASPKDAIAMLTPKPHCGIFNIKLMKCGSIDAARKIAHIADEAQIELMWGCMDESIISISAALHTAFACKATKYIDLDGSLDLGNDIVSGGFKLENGIMSVLDVPGLGVVRI